MLARGEPGDLLSRSFSVTRFTFSTTPHHSTLMPPSALHQRRPPRWAGARLLVGAAPETLISMGSGLALYRCHPGHRQRLPWIICDLVDTAPASVSRTACTSGTPGTFSTETYRRSAFLTIAPIQWDNNTVSRCLYNELERAQYNWTEQGISFANANLAHAAAHLRTYGKLRGIPPVYRSPTYRTRLSERYHPLYA
jgi:hypothetical protein